MKRLPKRTCWYPSNVPPCYTGPYEASLLNDKTEIVVEVHYDSCRKEWHVPGLYRGVLKVRKRVLVSRWRGLTRKV